MPTKIEWTGETWNPIRARLLSNPARVGWHCTHASSGCIRCYAERMNRRGIGTGLAYRPGNEKLIEIFLDERVLLYPLRWKRPRFIFPCSMTDLFGDFVTDAMLDRIFAVAALCPQHAIQILTKRPARMREYLSHPTVSVRVGLAALNIVLNAMAANPKSRLGEGIIVKATDINPGALSAWPLPNIWCGTSVEDDRVLWRIDALREVPAAIRWLSIEPMIGPLPDLDLAGIHWVVVGGESGPGARHFDDDWAREVRDACAAQGAAFFMKQRSSHDHPKGGYKDFASFPADLQLRQMPSA